MGSQRWGPDVGENVFQNLPADTPEQSQLATARFPERPVLTFGTWEGKERPLP